MVQKPLPRQLMPRAMTEDAPHTTERKVLGRIVEGFGRALDINRVVKKREMTCLCRAADEDTRYSSKIASDNIE